MCLWAKKSLAAIDAVADVNVELLENYPSCPQDLNPMENVWRELKERLAATEPIRMESRAGFLRRLNNAARWCNKHRARLFLRYCQDQKKRAADVLNAVPPGSRTPG